MGDVSGGEVVGSELGLELRDGSVDEERWVGGAGAAPNYVRRGVVVPGGGFCENARGFSGGGEVCGDEMKALRFVNSAGLVSTSMTDGEC